jgi:SPP1 gp7 family putative phage head morphogenesis protein
MARAAESSYNTRLRQVAKQIDVIIKGLAPDGIVRDDGVLKALRGYSEVIEPWAQSVARYMLADVSKRNAKAWKEQGNDIASALLTELSHSHTGHVFFQLQQQQVALIQSLPLDAAQRVHRLTQEALISSARASTVAAEILKTGQVSKARATLIARTEVSRTASNLTQARAQFAGSLGYIWRTSGDSDVRSTHKRMNGKYVPWGTPPQTDANLDPYHAGCGPNCRCYPEPVLP